MQKYKLSNKNIYICCPKLLRLMEEELLMF